VDAPEVRLSPDGHDAAVCNLTHPERPDLRWRATNGAYLTDKQVEGWTVLTPVLVDRATCPWCKKPDRKLTAVGALRKHGKPNTFPPQDCDGSGRTLEDYEYFQELGRLHAAEDGAS
jgi:hypothetical protein